MQVWSKTNEDDGDYDAGEKPLFDLVVSSLGVRSAAMGVVAVIAQNLRVARVSAVHLSLLGEVNSFTSWER